MSTATEIDRTGYNRFLLLVAGLGGLLYGIDVGIISGALPRLFAQAALEGMPVDSLVLFERLLALPDPDLQDMILHPELMPAGEFAELVAAVRAFHGLGGTER